MILLRVILGRYCCRFLVQPSFGVTVSPRCFLSSFSLCYFLLVIEYKQSNTKSSCFLFNSIFDYTWFQHNFKGYYIILLHVDEKFYIYGLQIKFAAEKLQPIFAACGWKMMLVAQPKQQMQKIAQTEVSNVFWSWNWYILSRILLEIGMASRC